MNNHQQISSEASILNQAIAIAQKSLSAFFDNLSDGSVAFGNNYDQNLAQELFQAFAQGDFTEVPSIKILSEEVLGATNGAYAKQKNEIYLNEKFLRENTDNPTAIANVIIEEIGHFIDAQINKVDSAGDEGDIFARLVNGESLSAETLANLKAEDDSKTIVLNGEEVAIEQNTNVGINLFSKNVLSEDFDLNGDFTNVYIGDFNGDGKSDFLRQEKGSWANDNNNTANVFLSNGNGSFNKINLSEDFALKGDFTNIYIGDFNGDGKSDFLRQEKGSIANDRNRTAEVFISNGSGGFNQVNLSEDFYLNGNLTNVYIGDFNGDGKSDFLRQEKGSWANDRNRTAEVFISNGSGGFNRVNLSEDFALNGNFTNVYIGDFNGDGKSDFLRQEKGSWVNDRNGTGRVFLSNGNGGFNQVNLPEDFGLSGDFTNIYIGDFNGDGKSDFLRQEKGSWANDRNGTADVFLSNGNGEFNKVNLSEDFYLNGDSTNIYIGDFDGDGKSDFLRQEKGSWANDRNGTAGVFISNGNGSFTKYDLTEDLDISGNFTNLYMGDFDGNRKTDLFRQEKGGLANDNNNTANVLLSFAIVGTSNNDTLNLSDRLEGYEVRLDGNNEGFAYSLNLNRSRKNLENKLYSIENVIGTNFNDKIYGDGNANRLQGNAGNDLLEGLSGNDTLTGGMGNDIFRGGAGSDRVSEQGNVNFRFQRNNRNQLQLIGLGSDTLIDIETVELISGISNNHLDGRLATMRLSLQGLEGNDTLRGGIGNDTLIGGKGINHLWGGEGNDTFVIDRSSTSIYSGDIQIIRDFDRTADTIDVAGIDLRNISFERNTVENYTLIKENGIDRAKVMGNARIDVSDLSAFRTIYQTLAANRIGDLDYVIGQWVQNYATNLRTTIVGEVSLANVSLTQGRVQYDPFTSIDLPNSVVTSSYINNTGLTQQGLEFSYTKKSSTTGSLTEQTSYSSTTTTAREHGWEFGVGFEFAYQWGTKDALQKTIKGTVSAKSFGKYSKSSSFTDGGSTTYQDIKLQEESTTQTYRYNAPAFSVTTFTASSSQTKYSGKYTMDVAVGGNIQFTLADDGNANNGINAIGISVPVELILEQYNPEIFRSKDASYATHTLLDGTELVYSPNLEFRVNGNLESVSTYDTKTSIDTTYDVLLSGGQNYQAQTGKERLWVAQGQLPLEGTSPVIINGFADGFDKIGFADVPEIPGFGSLERWNVGTSGFVGYRLPNNSRRALAELVGVNATLLDVNDFVFSTTGTAIA